MPQITFEGIVFSGKGEGKKFLSLPWVKKQVKQKLGFLPYAGTLNIRLEKFSPTQNELQKDNSKIEITPQDGYCNGFLFKARIGHQIGAIILPQVPSYPTDVIEFIADVCLREHFNLTDGDFVAVTVEF